MSTVDDAYGDSVAPRVQARLVQLPDVNGVGLNGAGGTFPTTYPGGQCLELAGCRCGRVHFVGRRPLPSHVHVGCGSWMFVEDIAED